MKEVFVDKKQYSADREQARSRISAKALIADAVFYLDVDEWTLPVVRAALAVAEFMAGTKRSARPSLEALGRLIERSTRRVRAALSVVCRRPDEPRQPRHVFVRRLVSSGEGRGRKASVYELDPEFEVAVVEARTARSPYRKRHELGDGMSSPESRDLGDGEAGPRGRPAVDLGDARGSRNTAKEYGKGGEAVPSSPAEGLRAMTVTVAVNTLTELWESCYYDRNQTTTSTGTVVTPATPDQKARARRMIEDALTRRDPAKRPDPDVLATRFRGAARVEARDRLLSGALEPNGDGLGYLLQARLCEANEAKLRELGAWTYPWEKYGSEQAYRRHNAEQARLEREKEERVQRIIERAKPFLPDVQRAAAERPMVETHDELHGEPIPSFVTDDEELQTWLGAEFRMARNRAWFDRDREDF